MLIIKTRLVPLLILIVLSAKPSVAPASCALPKMDKVTTGKFQVISTSPMSVPCVGQPSYSELVPEKKTLTKSFIAPGCLLKVRRLTPPEPGFNNDKIYEVYYEKDDCDKQIGKRLILQLTSQCCSEFAIRCNQDPSINKTQTAAHDGSLACAAPYAGHWSILPPGLPTDDLFKLVRERAKDSQQKK